MQQGWRDAEEEVALTVPKAPCPRTLAWLYPSVALCTCTGVKRRHSAPDPPCRL